MRAGLAFLVALAGCDKLLGLQIATVPPPADAPPDALPPGNWIAVAAGAEQTCAIEEADGSLWCWGRNEEGESGVGSGSLENTAPVRVGTARWTAVAGAAATVCGIHDDHTLWCWGDNGSGQLGPDASGMLTAYTPVQIPGQWSTVSIHREHACGLQADQTLWCWGAGTYGQLGPPAVSSAIPRQLPGTWQAVATGDSFTCGIQSDGSLWCFGHGNYYQLGNGTTADHSDPVRIGGSATFQAVAAGALFGCAIRSDGRLRCWGTNQFGQLGDSTTTSRPLPVIVGDDSAEWTTLDAGNSHACATRHDGSLWCWGDNNHGQLATTKALALSSSPIQIDVGHVEFTAVSVGDNHTCALSAEHNLWCAGSDGNGQLGDLPVHRTPVAVTGGPWHAIAAGHLETCAQDSANALWCWGDNTLSEIGDGTISPRAQPVPVADDMRASVTIGKFEMCELRGGSLWCWGDNSSAAFGDSTITSSVLPEPIATTPSTWTRVRTSAGSPYEPYGVHTCGIDPTNTLYCWGDNAVREAAPALATTPVTAPSSVLTGASDVGVGDAFTCAITSGKVECWGRNNYAQLGIGNQTDQASPTVVNVSPLVPVALVVGPIDSCALDATGAAACWGPNFYGEAGRGNQLLAVTPGAIAHTWRALAIGHVYMCGVTTEHTLWCWGYNARGQLGDGTQMLATSPQQIGSDSDWDEVAAGFAHACATKTDGRMFCWGDNTQGQLGDGHGWRPTLAIVPAP